MINLTDLYGILTDNLSLIYSGLLQYIKHWFTFYNKGFISGTGGNNYHNVICDGGLATVYFRRRRILMDEVCGKF